MFEKETIYHVLFRCNALSSSRLEMWSQVLDKCPQGELKNELYNMSDTRRAAFIISGLCDTYIPEWCSIYKAITEFIHVIYKEKEELTL